MPAEPGYELVVQIQERFKLRVAQPTFPNFLLGTKQLKNHGANQRIAFVDTGGSLQRGSTEISGNDDVRDLAADETLWDVYVWGTDRQNCRELFFELIRAARDIVQDGNNLTFDGDYRFEVAGETDRGRLLIKEGLVIREGMPERTAYDFTLVPVEHFSTDIDAPGDDSVNFTQDAPEE